MVPRVTAAVAAVPCSCLAAVAQAGLVPGMAPRPAGAGCAAAVAVIAPIASVATPPAAAMMVRNFLKRLTMPHICLLAISGLSAEGAGATFSGIPENAIPIFMRRLN